MLVYLAEEQPVEKLPSNNDFYLTGLGQFLLWNKSFVIKGGINEKTTRSAAAEEVW